MAWNEPGGDNDKNPWNSGNKKSPNPELEAALNKLKGHLGRLVGTGGSAGGKSSTTQSSTSGWIVLLIVIVLAWALSGIFKVAPAEKAVILQFGAYKDTVGPGVHWIPRIFDTVYKVDVQKIFNYAYDADMLTRDENIVNVAVAVQYRVDDAKPYLFNVTNPIASLQEATASALRQVIGNTTLDQILTSGREQVSLDVEKQLNTIIDHYNMGIVVTQVALQPAKAPDAVKDAFDDAIKAREDQQRYIKQAQAYAMQVIPQAEGQTQRLLADAQAYQQRVVLDARGETARYLALLPQYAQNPQITRVRLYMAAMEQVLDNSSKIVVDMSSKNNGGSLIYLPLDKLMSTTETTTVKVEDTAKNTTPDVNIPMSTNLNSLADYGDNGSNAMNNQGNNNPYGFKSQKGN